MTAACGATVDAVEEWRGTGSQKEYEIAAGLSKCRRCQQLVAMVATR